MFALVIMIMKFYLHIHALTVVSEIGVGGDNFQNRFNVNVNEWCICLILKICIYRSKNMVLYHI